LLAQKVETCKEVEKKTKIMLQEFSLEPEQIQHKEGEFIISNAKIPNAETDPFKIDKSMDCLTNISRWENLRLHLSEQFKELLSRGAKMRLITEKPINMKYFLHNLEYLLGSKNFQVRYITDAPMASMSVFDHNKMVVDLNPFAEPTKTPRLMTNHQSFIGVFQEYFEEIWNQAQEYEEHKQKAPRTAKQTQKNSVCVNLHNLKATQNKP
jgi:hypothetical protein